jgi:hypothetical protein
MATSDRFMDGDGDLLGSNDNILAAPDRFKLGLVDS